MLVPLNGRDGFATCEKTRKRIFSTIDLIWKIEISGRAVGAAAAFFFAAHDHDSGSDLSHAIASSRRISRLRPNRLDLSLPLLIAAKMFVMPMLAALDRPSGEKASWSFMVSPEC
jgi:hypothetical protein